ncbi:MAG: type II toxin-antitoxin system RelE/ParE family toxin [Sphingobacteriales bacterium]|jgi:plasmid stabilization system protein ParE|nr:MAG: type II toxin-antitoxin system RelE/ParE family toxin [Sphingobacteriales bacterium]
MVEQQYEVLWNATARKEVKKIYKYIEKESAQNAKKVINEIIEATEKLDINPERFGLDKYKNDNNGSYRYFELYRYRIVFRIYKSKIRILRVRSTDQEPLEY